MKSGLIQQSLRPLHIMRIPRQLIISRSRPVPRRQQRLRQPSLAPPYRIHNRLPIHRLPHPLVLQHRIIHTEVRIHHHLTPPALHRKPRYRLQRMHHVRVTMIASHIRRPFCTQRCRNLHPVHREPHSLNLHPRQSGWPILSCTVKGWDVKNIRPPSWLIGRNPISPIIRIPAPPLYPAPRSRSERPRPHRMQPKNPSSPTGTTPNNPSLMLNSNPVRPLQPHPYRQSLHHLHLIHRGKPTTVISVPSIILRIVHATSSAPSAFPSLKPHPIPQMKHPGQSIRLLPTANHGCSTKCSSFFTSASKISPPPAHSAHPSPAADRDCQGELSTLTKVRESSTRPRHPTNPTIAIGAIIATKAVILSAAKNPRISYLSLPVIVTESRKKFLKRGARVPHPHDSLSSRAGCCPPG